jgi:hypothetical protein
LEKPKKKKLHEMMKVEQIENDKKYSPLELKWATKSSVVISA